MTVSGIETNISKTKQALLIVLTSLILATIFYLTSDGNKLSYWSSILFSMVETAILWLGCVAIVTKLWRLFPWEYKPIKHLVAEIILILTYTNLLMLFWDWLVYKYFRQYYCEEVGREILVTNLITVFITSLHEAIFFYRQWQWHFSKSVRLERDHLEAKFEVLKAQLNPHFLFNSLNSLAAMLDGNAAAERYVEDLSYFMRYILKNRDNELIALDEELAMIHKYIALQKVRFEDNLQVKFSLEKDCSCLLIPPLSLQILLENCIKHNIVSSSKPLHIDIVCEGKMLSVSNKIQLKQQVESSGQGLRNIIERFSYYTPNEVRVENADGNFTVSLPLIQPQK